MLVLFLFYHAPPERHRLTAGNSSSPTTPASSRFHRAFVAVSSQWPSRLRVSVLRSFYAHRMAFNPPRNADSVEGVSPPMLFQTRSTLLL